MADNDALAERIRAALPDRDDLSERKMFGSVVFMVGDHMACGARRDGSLLARVGADGVADALDEPHVEPMRMGERTMKGYVFVGARGVADDESLQAWVDRCVVFAESLPAK